MFYVCAVQAGGIGGAAEAGSQEEEQELTRHAIRHRVRLLQQTQLNLGKNMLFPQVVAQRMDIFMDRKISQGDFGLIIFTYMDNTAEHVDLQLLCEDDIEKSVLCRQDLISFQAHRTIVKERIAFKRSCRPALKLVAPGSGPAEEDQDQARAQGSPRYWRGRWRG